MIIILVIPILLRYMVDKEYNKKHGQASEELTLPLSANYFKILL
jgi:hypothetical protein